MSTNFETKQHTCNICYSTFPKARSKNTCINITNQVLRLKRQLQYTPPKKIKNKKNKIKKKKPLRCKASYLDLLPHFHLETLTPINIMVPLH
jgi:hypothetical protein